MTQDRNRAVGICLGASTMTLVEIEKDPSGPGGVKIVNVVHKEHDGDPKSTLTQHLEAVDLSGAYLGATGRKFRKMLNLPTITEPEATEWAFALVNRDDTPYDAIVSAGAETFIVYQMDRKKRIARISSGNKCASGTGEFFLQQIKRMDIGLEEAISLSRDSTHPHALSGRCSVFCKSDCTHALNKGVPIGDVAAGLARMIAKKVEELLVKIGSRRVMLVGGTTRNDVVVNYLREALDVVTVPEEAPYFEALGAALWALDTRQADIPARGEYFKAFHSSFGFLKPISDYTDMVEFKEMPFEKARDGDECVLGLDVGSTTTKAVLYRTTDEKILASIYLRTNGNPIKASRECYKSLLEQLAGTRIGIVGLGVTGSGRYIAGLHADTEGIINEIIAHARAAAHFDPEVDTIYEIGGQDAKYTYLTNSVASDYAMNEACSAGTGSFLEESAHETLGIKMEDIAPIALRAKTPPNFSDQCAAFISSDINTASQEGIGKDDIVAGLVYSICINYINRVKGSRQTGRKVFMQGGVCYNKAIPIAMAGMIGKKIVVPPHPGLMGAYGVAIEVKNLMGLGLLPRGSYDLADLAAREVEYGKNFICHGKPENCDRKCEIAMIHIGDRKFPFGGACNKYYNKVRNLHYDVADFNRVETRLEIIFKQFAPRRMEFPAGAPVVGINRAFHTHTLYPFYSTFFTELGCRVVMPDQVRQSGIDKATTSYCLSGQIALGMFEDLLAKDPDYVWLPQIKEMHVSEQDDYRIEFQTTCMFVQGEPSYLRATFLRDKPRPKILMPVLNLMSGFDAEEAQFLKIAVDLGFTEEDGRRAHAAAFQRQNGFFAALKEEGRRFLAELESHPERTAVVLFGHPYNAFTDEANKGVPFKFASRGVAIIPFDFLAYEEEENFRDTYWEMGQRVIKAARIVKRHPQLFGVYLTNFLCAIDSMMVPHFRDVMLTKPSLTIEVDTHTADAGVNTRIEAFLDVVKNYLKVRDRVSDPVLGFTPARTEIDHLGHITFIDSDGKRFGVKDKRVKTVMPSMGDLFATSTAAVMRGLGWNCEALPVCDREALDLGRSVTTSKECLPIINIVGEILKYLKHRENPEEKLIVLMVAAGGCCRVGQYAILINTVIEKLKLKNVALFTLSNDDGYAGLGLRFRFQMGKSLYISDVMDDVRSVIKGLAVDREAGMKVFQAEMDKLLGTFDGTLRVPTFKQLQRSAKELSRIKLRTPLASAKYIGVVGEIFVRRDHYSLMGIPEKLAEHGFVMLDAPVSEWVRYTDFLRDIDMYEARHSFIGKIEFLVSGFVQDRYERKTKRIMETTGLYEYELIDIRKYMVHSTHFFPLQLTGEPGLSSGSALYHMVDKYCGTISVGPFGCMNSRMTEAVASVEMSVEGKERASANAGIPIDVTELKKNTDVLPFYCVELDGNPFSQIEEARFETFLLQADRLHQEMMKRRAGVSNGNGAGNGHGNGSGSGRRTKATAAEALTGAK